MSDINEIERKILKNDFEHDKLEIAIENLGKGFDNLSTKLHEMIVEVRKMSERDIESLRSDMREKISEIKSNMKSDFDKAEKNQKELEVRINEKFKSLDVAITKLEELKKYIWMAIGIGTAIGFLPNIIKMISGVK